MQPLLERTGGLSLRQVLPEGKFFGAGDVRITSCAGEASACTPGDLFVALVGPETDGHDDVAEAVRRGAAAILAERLLPVSVPVCVVPDTREVYGRVCQKLAGEPGSALRLVGVTGTHGKTTTSLLLASMFQAARQPVGTTTTIGHWDSVEMSPARRTTPNPPELAYWLSRMHANGCTHAVIEASSSGLAQHRLAGLELDAAVLTNLRREHIDCHGSVLNYRRTKLRLFEYLKPHGFAAVNADDPGSRLALGKLECPLITFGMREDAEIMAEVVERYPGEQTFLLMAGCETVPVRTRFIGDHHVANCLAAAAVGLVMGLDLTTIARGLESLGRLPGRLDRVECGQPFAVYVDSADNADRLAVCLKSLRRVTRGRVLCVFGSDGEERREERPLLGRVLEKSTDLCVLTHAHHGRDTSLETIHQILDGYDRAARAHVIPSRSRAILWTLQQAQPGDAVLIAGNQPAWEGAEPGDGPLCRDTDIARHWLYQSARLTTAFSETTSH